MEKTTAQILAFNHALDWSPDDYEPVKIPLIEAIKVLEAELAKIPKSSRSMAMLEISVSGDYARGHFDISWERLETSDEVNARAKKAEETSKKARLENEKRAAKKEAHEKAEYERLKMKFGE